VNQQINNISSLRKSDPTVFPGQAENLADKITLVMKLDNKNQSLPNLNDEAEETASTTIVQKERPPIDLEAVLITFAIYFTTLTFLLNIILLPHQCQSLFSLV